MRGLTTVERELLTDALTPTDPDEDEALPAEQAVFEDLLRIGRVHEVAERNDEWEWVDWRATDLGRLALRVCPREEA